MIRISQILIVAGLFVLAACGSTGDVAAEGQGGSLSTEAELTCCQESAMSGKTECCGENIEGKYRPVTGQTVEE